MNDVFKYMKHPRNDCWVVYFHESNSLVNCSTEREAKIVCVQMNLAYRTGWNSAQREIREALGIEEEAKW